MRVLAALSGGVDSAVAAAMAVADGHDVTGVHLLLSRAQGCTSGTDEDDARRTADALGIELLTWDLSATFDELVVADLVAGYAAGLTPNPCVRCNQHVKLAAVVDRAVAEGFDAVCTGHYARVADGNLFRAACEEKDQSYVIAVAGPERLRRVLLPLGGFASKDEVRARATSLGIPVAGRAESFDICFIPDGDLVGYLRARLGSRPGEIVDQDGAVVGAHDGAYGFTVGQRKGLRLGRPAADGRPRYVLGTDPQSNRVVVGPAPALDVHRFVGTDPVWYVQEQAWPCEVQVRAHARPVPGRVVPSERGVEVEVDEPIRGLASGQSVVCCSPEGRVLLQATISTRARRDEARPAGTVGG